MICWGISLEYPRNTGQHAFHIYCKQVFISRLYIKIVDTLISSEQKKNGRNSRNPWFETEFTLFERKFCDRGKRTEYTESMF